MKLNKLFYLLLVSIVLISCSKNSDDTQEGENNEEEQLDCDAAVALSASEISFFSAFLTWESNSNDVSRFTLEYGEAGFANGSGTIVNNAIPFSNYENLKAATTY